MTFLLRKITTIYTEIRIAKPFRSFIGMAVVGKVLLVLSFLFGIAAVPVHACTNVSGTIASAIWTKANSPYCVEGDILAASLVIEPGVEVQFQGDYIFEVAGVLTAIGTEQDQITFTKAATNDVGWQGMFFNYSSPSTELKYCIIEYSINGGMYIDNSGPTISYCTIRNNSLSGQDQKGGGVFTNVPLTLDNCTISNNSITSSSASSTTSEGGGIYAESSLVLNNCTISNNSSSAARTSTSSYYTLRSYGGGIFANGDLELNNCLVFGNEASTSTNDIYDSCYSYGGGVYTNATGIIKNSTISYNSTTASCSSTYRDYVDGGGVYCYLSDISLTNIEVVNSILWENSEGQISGDVTVTYSDVQGSFEGEGNINLNPVFQSDTDLTIVSGSPCIDAGNPDAQYNDVCFLPSLGTERNDMGANGGPGACLFLESGCIFSISPTSDSFISNGGTGSVSVIAGIGCSWTAKGNDTWITITSGSSGTGQATVSYTVAEYTDTTSRTGTMTIASKTFTVSQDGVCSYTISQTNQSFDSEGGTDSVDVTVSDGCSWTASSNDNWITIDSGSSGTGQATVSYTVAENTDASSRTGTMTIAGETFTVTQGGFSCSYAISPTNQSFDYAGGTDSVDVTATDVCDWTAVSNDDWITVDSGSSGTGPATVSYTVAENTVKSSRTGTMTIAGEAFTVTQYGVCDYFISSSSQTFDFSGGTGSVSVSDPDVCGWTATSNNMWITIYSGSSDSGDGDVSYSVSANTVPASRTGTMTIARNTFTITQNGCATCNNIFEEDFESDWGTWFADQGVWEIGVPTTGPAGPYGGSQCAATVLDGDYNKDTDSRLISSTIKLPDIMGNEEIHLRFWHWFSYASYGTGYVQVSDYDEVTREWSDWASIGNSTTGSSSVWSLADYDLTNYAGKNIRLAFYHTTSRYSSTGWYIDDIQITNKVPEFTGDFESGWGDWHVDRGIWEIGVPTTGPAAPYGGSQCAATVLDGNYNKDTDSRLISPTIILPDISGDEEIHLRFWHWFSYAGYGTGYVQVSDYDEVAGEWSDWASIGNSITGTSSVWSLADYDLTNYAGKKTRIALYHTTSRYSSTGWYIDDLNINPPPTSCYYVLSTYSEAFGPSGGTGNVSIADVNGCGWEAINNDTDWITITSGSSGTGQATVSYTVTEYTGTTSRTGTMTIAGKTFTVTQHSLDDGLVAYYPFNGNADDESGNGNDGTVNGATLAEDRFGNPDSAYSFDGVDDYIEVSDFSFENKNQCSISLWVKPTTTDTGGQAHELISKFSGGNDVEILVRREWDGKYDVEWTIGSNFYDLSANSVGVNDQIGLVEPSYNIFDFFVAIYDGEEIKLYINGELIESATASGEIVDNSYPLTIGASASNPSRGNFEGIIDDIRIYDRALSESEIQELYQGEASCASISPTSGSFYSSGVTGSVSVTAEDDCGWTSASNDPDWITIQSGSSGYGDGTVTYFVSENPYTTTRTGTMAIAGTIFTVSQDGTGSIDDTAPSVTILFPTDGITQNLLYIITGSSIDPPPSSGIDRVEIQVFDRTNYLGSDDEWYATEQWITVDGTESWSHDTGNVTWEDETTYTITAKVYDNEGYEGTTSIEVDFLSDSGGQAYSTLGLELSSQTILQNETIDASGKLTRLPDNGDGLSSKIINLTISAPDGTDTTQTTTTYNTLGHYKFEEISGFTQKGTYTIQASFDETDTLVASSSDTLSVLVGSSAGYAIIVQGKISSEEGLDSHNKTANRIYDTLLARGFEDENIYYFNYDTSQTGVDAYPTAADIQNAIGSWPMDKMNGSPAPLYIIMHDHGNTDTFYLDNETITPNDLDSWLDTLESGLTPRAILEKRIIIYGACYSGSFISALSKAPTDTDGGRMIVTSAAEDEESYKGTLEPDGIRSGSYFLEEFFNELERGYSIKESFESATDKTETYTRTGGGPSNTNNAYFDSSMQHPLLDDDGDRTGSNALSDGTGDGQIAAGLYLGTGVTLTNSLTADILYVTETVHLDHSTSTYTMWATANDNNAVSSAWMEIRPPSQTLSETGGTEQLSTDYTKELMSLNESTDNWEKQIDTFTESGMYEIYYYVKDVEDLEISPTKRSVVYKDETGNNPPGIFDLKSPDNGSKQKTILIFEWESSTDPDEDNITYNLIIATDSSFSNVVYREEEITTTATIVDTGAGLSDLTTYYWKVQAVDAYGLTTDSKQTWPFYTNNTNAIPGFIFGVVYDETTFIPIEGATISTDLGSKVVSIEGGDYFLEISAGTYTITSSHSNYSNGPISGIRVNSGETTELNMPMSSSAAGTSPVPGIKANDSEETLNINEGDQLTIAVSLDPGSYSGTSADWYIAVDTPSGQRLFFDLSQMDFSASGILALLQDYDLFSLSSTEIYSTSGLSTGTYTYYFAVDLNGQLYLDSVAVTVDTGGVSTPTGFTASANGSTLTLGWNAASGAEGYKVYYGFSSGDYIGSVDLGNTTGQSFSGIPAGTYYLAVTAYTSSSESGYSNEQGVFVNVQQGDFMLTKSPVNRLR